jgi:hypothetical protein
VEREIPLGELLGVSGIGIDSYFGVTETVRLR